MNLKKVFLFCIVSCFALSVTSQIPYRLKETINSQWKFFKGDEKESAKSSFDDASWENVNLPHTWNVKDVNDETRGYYMGVGWYRKKLNLPISLKNKKVYIFFEGANQETDVFVNGNFAGNHKGGYTAFCFDVTNFLSESGPNYLAVKVDSRINPSIPPLQADFTFYGGIYRDVYLITTNDIHFDLENYSSPGVFIETPLVTTNQADVKVRGKVVNKSTKNRTLKITSQIKDASGKTVGEVAENIKVKLMGDIDFSQLIKLADIKLWSPESPYLYTVETTISDEKTKETIDYVSNPLGLRFYSFDANKGFFLNGKHCKLIGANRHQDYKDLGNALPDELHYRDIKLLKEMGGNFIRIAHYPQDPALLEACDRLGVIAWEEIPIVNYISETQEFADNCVFMMKEMIRQHYNHPSILIWGYMNEILLKLPYKGAEAEKLSHYKTSVLNLAQRIENTIRSEDSQRYTAIAFHGSFEAYNDLGLTKIPKINGWNLYQGWYGGELSGFSDFVKKSHLELPDKPIIISEYGAGSDARIHALKPHRFDFSVEWQIKYNQTYLETIFNNDYIAGAVAWNFVDFSSEGRKDTNPQINNKGLMTTDRKPKDVYYFYQAQLLPEPMIKIASENYKVRSGFAISRNENTSVQQVQVFSNLPEAELFQNGKSLSKKTIVANQAFWDVPFVNGVNLLEAKSGSNNAKDFIKIDFDLQPTRLDDSSFRAININCGADFTFINHQTNEVWFPDQPFKEGSYGYMNARILTLSKGQRIGSDKPISGTDLEPIYQTQLDSVQAYKIDVGPGDYRVTFHYADLTHKKATEKLVYNLGADSQNIKVTDNLFDVFVNGTLIEKEFDINQYGEGVAVQKDFIIHIDDMKGLNITFKPVKGLAFINGLSIKKIK